MRRPRERCASARRTRAAFRRRRRGAPLQVPLTVSCQMRSARNASISPAATISFMSSRVSAAIVNFSGAKRAAKRATRSTRSGSSRNAGDTWRRTRAARSARPDHGSTISPSSPRAMALIVRSRRLRSSSSVTLGAASNSKPVYPGAVLRSVRARAYSSPVRGCRNTGKSLPTRRYPWAVSSSADAPTTTQSRSSTGRPSSASRTAPPTS